MKYWIVMICLVVLMLCVVKTCEEDMYKRRGADITEESILHGNGTIECNEHEFKYVTAYLTKVYIHSIHCPCGEVTSVDSAMYKLYGFE